MEIQKIEKFTDLIAWKEGHKLVLMIYEVSRKFPVDERFGLTTQIQRCAVSITSNIAEGFSRNTPKDKNHFFYISLGSITEMQNQLLIARDLGYININQVKKIGEQSVLVQKLINGLVRSNKNRIKK